MSTMLKRIILILIVLMLLFSINSKVFAWSDIKEKSEDFLSQADSSLTNIDSSQLQGISGYLYNILLAAGVVIAVIVATVLGVQFMLGGAEGQAKVKEMLIPYVVGCIIVFGGFGIWKIAVTVGQKFEDVSETSYFSQGQQEAKSYISNHNLSECNQKYKELSEEYAKTDENSSRYEYLRGYIIELEIVLRDYL